MQLVVVTSTHRYTPGLAEPLGSKQALCFSYVEN